MSDGVYDEVFLGMAQRHDGIDGLLDTFFSFLERRTDFFHTLTSTKDRMGFPAGRSEQLLQETYWKHQLKYTKRAQPDLLDAIQSRRSASKNAQKHAVSDSASPPAAQPGTSPGPKGAAAPAGAPTSTAPAAPASLAAAAQAPSTDPSPKAEQTVASAAAPAASSGGWSSSSAGGNSGFESSKHISAHNGGITDKYRWSQTLTEVTVEVGVPKCRGSELKVEIKAAAVKVSCRGVVVMEGELHEPIHATESLWNLEDGERVVLSLEKSRECWWPAVLRGDPEIDTSKVDSSKRIDEYDPETQGALRKIMFDQNQKARGLPSSDELKTYEALEKAWNAEGSPFKGRPFDPSLVNLSGAGMPPRAPGLT